MTVPVRPTRPVTRSGGRPSIDCVWVVIPVHDEEARLEACLTSVVGALERHRASAEVPLRCGVVVVLDRCTDASAAITDRFLGPLRDGHGVTFLAPTANAGSAGAARRFGVELVRRHRESDGSRTDPRAVLVLNTDGDCVVPPAWVVDHLAFAAEHDLVQGWVSPEPGEMSSHALAVWWSRHPPERGSLHGANLGFRLAPYLAAGGFLDLPVGEDLALVRAMKDNGAAAVCGTRVVTSARHDGRAVGGFAAYLRDLDRELADLADDPGVADADPRSPG